MTDNYSTLHDRTTKRTVSSTGKITRVHSQKFRLESDDLLSTAAAGDLFTELTGIAEMIPLGDDPAANCRAINVTAETSRAPWKYIVDVEWSTETPDSQQQDREQDDPFAEPVEIDTDDELQTFPLFKDRDDTMIANTVGDPLAMEGEKSIEVITMSRNEPRADRDRDRKFRNAVNRNEFSGAAPGTVKIRKIRNKLLYRKGIPYYRYTYELAYKADGWEPELLNAGLYQLNGSDRVPCVDKNREPVSEPVPIDDLSVQLLPSELPDGAHFLTFNTLNEQDFAELGLPE